MFPSRETPVDPVSCVLALRRACGPFLRFARFVLAGGLALAAMGNDARAKTPGGVHCHGKTCHRVSTLAEMDGSVGRFGVMMASFYDDCRTDRFNTCGLTSSGEVFRPGEPDNAASPNFPDGTVLLTFNPATKKAAVVRVNSAGPYWGERKLDVSRATAEKLGFREKGVAELMVAIIRSPDEMEARYQKKRRYAPVPGYIGVFASFEAAHDAAIAGLSLKFQAGSPQITARPGHKTRLAAIEPEPELPSLKDRRADLQPRPSRQEMRQLTIIYLDPVPPQEVIPVQTGTESSETVRASPAVDGEAHGILQETTLAKPAILETFEPHGASDEIVMHLEAPIVVVTAHEPAYWGLGLGVTIDSGGFWHKLTAFVAEARRRARPRGEPFVLPAMAEWRPRIEMFVHEARAKARAGVTRSGPLYDLFADLKSKAQAVRD